MTDTLTPDRVRADVARTLGCAATDLREDEDLFERGLDSVRLMALVERWRRAEGVDPAELDFPALAERPEIGAWVDLLCG